MLAKRAWFALGPIGKMRGLLWEKPLEKDEALVLSTGTPQVHTFFMAYPVSVIFLSNDRRVIALENLVPWRFSRFYPKAWFAIEMLSGGGMHHVQKGDLIEWAQPI